jgi:Ca2+-binding EF-hand superfamily protein
VSSKLQGTIEKQRKPTLGHDMEEVDPLLARFCHFIHTRGKSMKEVDIWDYFLDFDLNQDGKISNLEFGKALHSLSFQCSRQQARDLLEMIDVGKDKQIDREEFYR